MKRIVDSHTHSAHSYDGKQPLASLVLAAKNMGLRYLAVTEHVDLETTFENYKCLNYDAYYSEFQSLKQGIENPYLAFGYEFAHQTCLENEYLKVPHLADADVIINSVHSVKGVDPYYGKYYLERGKQSAYNDYFQAVLDSLNAPYPYHILGHIGYVMRYASYKNRLPEGDTLDLIDEIFKKAIALDKTVEVNVHVKTTGLVSLPTPSMLKRFRELGGENITFSSDAHQTERLTDKFDITSEMLKTMGFNYFTVYEKGKPIKIKI